MPRHARANLGQFLGGGDQVHGRGQPNPIRGGHGNCHHLPRTRGMWMNSHGEGIGPTGTSIRVGSRRGEGAPSAARSSSGLRARRPAAPKLSAYLTKSGLARSRGDQPVAEVLLLDAPHIAEGAVGEHDRDQRNAVAHGGGEFVAGVQEAAVAVDREHRHVAAARAARRARWHSPSRDCPDSRARETCAACRPGRRGARQSRSASPRRRRCRPPAIRRGSRRGRRAAARAWRGAARNLRLALLHLVAARGAARDCVSRSASISRRRIGAASPISATVGLCEARRLLRIGIDADDLRDRRRCPTA